MPLQVLTPPSVVKVLARGYRPVVHPSVGTPVAMPVPPTPARTAPVSEPAADRLPPETTRTPPVAGCKPEPPANTAVNSAGERLYRLEKTPSGKAL